MAGWVASVSLSDESLAEESEVPASPGILSVSESLSESLSEESDEFDVHSPGILSESLSEESIESDVHSVGVGVVSAIACR